MTAVCFVVPEGLDDPARPSGGNAYDRRVRDGLRGRGWDVRELVASGPWPRPDAAATAALAGGLARVPDGAVVLVDGLIASAAAPVLVPEAGRVRLVVLVHMPLGGAEVPERDECRVLARAAAVLTTSGWTRQFLLDRYLLPPGRVTIATPGADLLDPGPGAPDGARLLCVGAVVRDKGQDLLLDALTRIAELPWTGTLVGSLDREPTFVDGLRRQAAVAGIAGRLHVAGPLAGDALIGAYRASDLLVHPSRREAYGMVITEALGAGLPVVATAVGGVPEALGHSAGGVPGRLVPPDDAGALAEALRTWLLDSDLRAAWRAAARERRRDLAGWDATVTAVESVLA